LPPGKVGKALIFTGVWALALKAAKSKKTAPNNNFFILWLD
jgi:hypothetical protein